MTLQIDPDKARERIDEFLEQIDDLLEKRYDEGKEEKRTMSTKLDNFAEVAFSDGKEKKDSLHPSVVFATFGEKNPQEKQRRYEKSLKQKKRHLKAWKQQIELEEEMISRNEYRSETYEEIE